MSIDIGKYTTQILSAALLLLVVLPAPPARAEPLYVTFVRHLHQPIYWPGENLLETANAGHYSFDLVQTHRDRTGPCTGWPRDAVGAARSAGLGRCGAQVSLTGSLTENRDVLEAGGAGFPGWKGPWQAAAGGSGCQGGGGPTGPFFAFAVLGLLGLGASRRRRGSRARGRGALLGVGLLGLALVAGACGPTGQDRKDASAHDATFPQDGAVPTEDASLVDAAVSPDAASECTESPAGRTGTTIFLLNGQGQESAEPITVGTVVTVSVEIEVTAAPAANIGFLLLDTKNLAVDRTSFTLGGSPLTVSDPFDGVIPMTLAVGSHEVRFEAAVQSQAATLEVDAALGYGSAGRCPIDRSHSLAVLQVLGGIEKGVDCYDLDQARSVQVSPYVPLQSTAQYQTENGARTDVLIDELVVGGPTCPGPGVLVHQISKCFLRGESSTVSLSGAAYGGEGWFVDDILLVEVLDANEQVVSALTTWQQGTQTLGCCQSPPCTSSLSYEAGGPTVSILNVVQGGGNNGDIAAGAFDLTSHLPPGPGPFFLRFTALDQGVEGALDRVFLNVSFP